MDFTVSFLLICDDKVDVIAHNYYLFVAQLLLDLFDDVVHELGELSRQQLPTVIQHHQGVYPFLRFLLLSNPFHFAFNHWVIIYLKLKHVLNIFVYVDKNLFSEKLSFFRILSHFFHENWFPVFGISQQQQVRLLEVDEVSSYEAVNLLFYSNGFVLSHIFRNSPLFHPIFIL